jgi:hypothetical protein
MGVSTSTVHGGAHALELDVVSGGGLVDLELLICQGASIPLSIANKSIGAWVYVATTSLDSSQQSQLGIGLTGCRTDGSNCQLNSSPVTFTAADLNKWKYISTTVSSSSAATNPNLWSFGFQGNLFPVGAAIIYVDDIAWQ